jgi:hypothetical protein
MGLFLKKRKKSNAFKGAPKGREPIQTSAKKIPAPV